MAIQVCLVFSANIIGDGSSTSFSVDFSKDIGTWNSLNGFVPANVPTTLLEFTGDPVPAAATMNGTVVTFTYSTAPAATSGQTVSVTFGF